MENIYFEHKGVNYKFPAYWEVCSLCDGRGAIVNPSIDGDGISTSSELWHDDEFRDNYRSGVYDITCPICNGRTTVLVPDTERLDDTIEVAEAINEWWSEVEEKIDRVYRNDRYAY